MIPKKNFIPLLSTLQIQIIPLQPTISPTRIQLPQPRKPNIHHPKCTQSPRKYPSRRANNAMAGMGIHPGVPEGEGWEVPNLVGEGEMGGMGRGGGKKKTIMFPSLDPVTNNRSVGCKLILLTVFSWASTLFNSLNVLISKLQTSPFLPPTINM